MFTFLSIEERGSMSVSARFPPPSVVTAVLLVNLTNSIHELGIESLGFSERLFLLSGAAVYFISVPCTVVQ